MTGRRTPAKRRGLRDHACCPAAATQPDEDTNGIPAPGHLGGQFEDAGYGHVTGTFGSSQWMPGTEDP